MSSGTLSPISGPQQQNLPILFTSEHYDGCNSLSGGRFLKLFNLYVLNFTVVLQLCESFVVLA